jgi:viologen exporter family transport system ATP-binding protein
MAGLYSRLRPAQTGSESGTESAIEARGLAKTFFTVRRQPGMAGALRSLIAPDRVAKPGVVDVTFSVARGELVALLGPNGAGKSTTIKMLTGILTPTAGHATVAGVVPYRERERTARTIGAVFGQRSQLWWDLPAHESFQILADIYDVDRSAYRTRLGELDDLLGLSGFWQTRVRHLSLGQRVCCDLAGALLHDPPVVFLDEPTIGMDVVVKEQVRGLLRHEVERRGRTVLLTTHDMGEVERLAERVVLINHGRIVLDGTLNEIRTRFGGGWRVHATLLDPGAWTGARIPGLTVLRRDEALVVLGPDGDEPALRPHQALKRVIESCEVVDVRVEESDIDEVMRAAYLDGGDRPWPAEGAE